MAHDLLLVHATMTLVLAGIMWAIQLTIIPIMARDTATSWPRHAHLHRRIFHWIFWPVVVVEGASGFGIALLQPAGIPLWLHVLNLGLILTAWVTMLVVRVRLGHAPAARYNPVGFLQYARLNWIRVAVWTARSGVVVAMLRMAATARPGLP